MCGDPAVNHRRSHLRMKERRETINDGYSVHIIDDFLRIDSASCQDDSVATQSIKHYSEYQVVLDKTQAIM